MKAAATHVDEDAALLAELEASEIKVDDVTGFVAGGGRTRNHGNDAGHQAQSRPLGVSRSACAPFNHMPAPFDHFTVPRHRHV
jgi:hypothetical protein